jgi:hypothetical protein
MLAPAVQPAGSGGFLAGLFGGEGMFGMSAGATGLVGGLGLMGASQAKDPVSGGLMGAAGGAMLGVSLLGGPVGWALGLLGGGAMGIFSGSKAKREQEKAKEEQEEAERQAAEALEAQRKAAANIIRTHIRTSLGGGLADTSAMASVGSLFSGDISPEEVQQFGNVEAILARGAEVSGLAAAQGGNVTNLGGVSIQVRVENVASTYDVQQLATDLGYYLQQNFAGA